MQSLSIWIIDYIYMCMNNVIISNNQSKDLIALWCLHVTPFYMQFTLFILFAKSCGKVFTVIIHISHWIAQTMNSERAGVLLAAVLIYLCLMRYDFVWLYSMLFRWHRNVMEFVWLRCHCVLLAVSGWG